MDRGRLENEYLAVRKLFVVLKVTSRCNLDCSYCNIFNGVDTSVYHQPAQFTIKLAEKLGAFLWNAFIYNEFDAVHVVIHGGEPLLLKETKFQDMLDAIRGSWATKENLHFSVQTNGVLITPEWVEIFARNNLDVGISIDGPSESHDKYRKFKSGAASFTAVERGINLVRNAVASGTVPSLGLLAVWNKDLQARKLYDLVTRDFGLSSFDVLFPDATHDNVHGIEKGSLGKFLIELFYAWFEDSNTKTMVRFVGSVFAMLSGGRSLLSSLGETNSLAITVDTDGSLRLDDHLRSCADRFSQTGLNISQNWLSEFISYEVVRYVQAASITVPAACTDCLWRNKCRGGELIHRYKDGSFDNPSIYCSELKGLFSEIARSMLKNGYRVEDLMVNLGI